jgi:hypothetical protein
MLVSGIKSRPTYPGLAPDPYAKQNIVVADIAGADAVVSLLKQGGDAFARRTTILLVGRALPELQNRLAPATVWIFPTLATALVRLSVVLHGARMGMRLYAAGDEPLLGSVVKCATEHGVEHNSVRTEHRGSTRRLVQCVHCKGITENVTTNPVICAHCGTALLVRDHYSRRIGAFMGVRIDAEAPGQIPETVGEFK